MNNQTMPFTRQMLPILPYIAAMTIIVTASNFLVQHPVQYFGLQNILTWGALTYPIAFLINDMTNRALGLKAARRVIIVGFALAVILSIFLATPRIAIASGTAFLIAQLLDAGIFDKLRRAKWWQAPLLSSLIGAMIDTILFFGIAFAASFAFLDAMTGMENGSLVDIVPTIIGDAPLWVSLGMGDFGVKILVSLAMLLPYGMWLKFRPTATAL